MTPEFGMAVIGAFFTLAVFSYLLGDNPLFRFALYLFIGVTAGYLAYIVFKMLLVPWIVQRFILGDWNSRFLGAVPLFLGWMVFGKYTGLFTRGVNRYSQVVLAFLIGAGSAVALGGALTGTLIPQAWGLLQIVDRETLQRAGQSGLLPLAGAIGNGAMIVLGTLTTVLAFHYGNGDAGSEAPGPQRAIVWIAKIGRFFVAAALGVIFGGIYQAGLTALVERVQFMVAFFQGLAGLR